MKGVVLTSVGGVIVRFPSDSLLGPFLCADTRQLDEFDTCSTNRMRPVNGAFRVRNTASYFIQEVGGWNWTVKRSYEVRGESI